MNTRNAGLFYSFVATAFLAAGGPCAAAGNAPLEQLLDRAGHSAPDFPRPAGGKDDAACRLGQVPPCPGEAAEAAAAREEWLRADKLYAPGVFNPPKQARIDAAPSYDVMFQGFHWFADNYWLHFQKGWWGELASHAQDLKAAGFTMIWFPPAGIGSYYQTELYNLHSQWGDKNGLLAAVHAMHANGIKVLADAVLNHRSGRDDWADFFSPDWPTTVVVQNDSWPGVPGAPYNGKSPDYSEGMLDPGSRNIDHRNPQVMRDYIVFLRWLRYTIGYDGWRYDFVNGYAPRHIQTFNEGSQPAFSVGEYWQHDRQAEASWMDGTDSSPGKANASSAFDYPTHFNVEYAAASGDYGGLNDNGKPSGLVGWWPMKTVTFVENHDTAPRDPKFVFTQEYKDQRMQGYAYILTHPGIPCVFWPHFFDWGQGYRAQIVKLMAIRKAAGVNSVSPVSVVAAGKDLYAALVTGDKQDVAVKLGSSWAWNPPGAAWTLAASGGSYAVWTRPR
ncbi:MAG: alpha-amylase family glycosyl hydrolase [Elusimicrobia bacterium]|nr:alpha-amylase family glycosyl hydrolase [Elusimicrobiota bacterium]